MNRRHQIRRNTPDRRKPDSPKGWYRTLLRSYLYHPPVWVYLSELAVVAVIIFVVIFNNKECASSILTHIPWGQK